MVYKPTPFDNPETYGAPSASDAELRAIIAEMKNTSPGALAPPPRRPRERVPGMQKMISKVSGTKQGTRIPGLGFVPDPSPDAGLGDEGQIAPKPSMQSGDPFSSAEVYPFGMKNRHLAAIGATAASVVPGVGPALGGALGGLGMYGLTTEDKDLDPTGAGLSAMTGGLGGMLMGKILPPVAKAIGNRLPNFTNDAKVGAEMLNPSAPGSPFDRAGTKLAPAPRPDTVVSPPPEMTTVSGPPNGALRRPMNPMQTQASGPPAGMTQPGRMVPPQSTRVSGPPPDMTQAGALAPRPRPPVSPGFMPDKSTLMYPPMQTGAMSNQPVNFGGGTVNQRIGGLSPRPPQPMQFGQEYDTLVQPRTMMGSESPSIGGMTPTPGLPRVDPTLVPRTGQTADVVPFLPTQINPTRVTPPSMGALSFNAAPAQSMLDLPGLLDRLRQQNPALYYALIAGAGAGYGGAGALGFNALGQEAQAAPEVPPSPYAIPRPYAVQR